jgi:hypothetical protein
MPRSGWRKPVSDRRLSELASVGVLARVFPPDAVDRAVASVGRKEARHRELPARVMAYFAVAMALYSEGSYEVPQAVPADGHQPMPIPRENDTSPNRSVPHRTPPARNNAANPHPGMLR